MNRDSIIRVQHNKDNPYTIVSRKPFEDSSLSWKAKGLLAYCLSRPPGWEIRTFDLIKRSKDGRDAVFAGLRELEAAGYLKREQLTGDKGRFGTIQYLIAEDPALLLATENGVVEPISPHPENPYTDNPDTGKPYTENPTQSINKGLENMKTTTEGDAILSTEGLDERAADAAVVVVDLTNSETYRELAPLVGKKIAVKWLEAYGRERVTEVLSWSLSQAQKNRGGYIRRALEEEWVEPAPVAGERANTQRRVEQQQIAAEAEAQAARDKTDREARENAALQQWWESLQLATRERLWQEVPTRFPPLRLVDAGAFERPNAPWLAAVQGLMRLNDSAS